MRIEYHRTLIGDKPRVDAFYRALSHVIKAGETTVADIGAGTGLLGVMADKLGARQVYLYEVAEVSSVAQETISANEASSCELMPCHSSEMFDPPQVDVIVSETLGNYAFEENIIDTLNDARSRFLKPGGLVLPARITQLVSPVLSDRIDRELRVWDDVGHNIDLSVARDMSLNNVYVRRFSGDELVSPEGVVWDEVDMCAPAHSARSGEARFKLEKDSRIYGLCVWWVAELVPGVNLSTGPCSAPTHWEQLYFPVQSPIDASMGEEIVVSIRSRSSEESGTHLAWSVSHVDASGLRVAQQTMDLDRGYLP